MSSSAVLSNAPSANLRGALFMSLAMATFVINDSIVKMISSHMNIGQIIFVRGLFAIVLLLLIAGRSLTLTHIKRLAHRSVYIRTAAEILSSLAYLFALRQLPLATIVAIMQFLPLLVTFGAIFIYKEPVGWRRLAAIIAGLVGVMIVVRPGVDGINGWALLALLSVVFCAFRDLATHSLPRELSGALVSVFAMSAMVITGYVVLESTGGWQPMPMSDILWLLLAAVALTIGYQSIVTAMRIAEISSVVPFRYTGLVWGIVLGFVMFGEIPDMAMLIGGAIIVGSGLYAFHRERQVNKTRPIENIATPAMAPEEA